VFDAIFLIFVNSVANPSNWFLIISTFASKLKKSVFFFLKISRLLDDSLGALSTLSNVSLLFTCSCFKNFLRSSYLSCFSFNSILPLEKFIALSLILSSRFPLDSTVSCHFNYSWWRSACCFLNSSEVLSSSIWLACVSVTSFSSSFALLLTSTVNLSIWH
jgi:hypothetical protein